MDVGCRNNGARCIMWIVAVGITGPGAWQRFCLASTCVGMALKLSFRRPHVRVWMQWFDICKAGQCWNWHLNCTLGDTWLTCLWWGSNRSYTWSYFFMPQWKEKLSFFFLKWHLKFLSNLLLSGSCCLHPTFSQQTLQNLFRF